MIILSSIVGLAMGGIVWGFGAPAWEVSMASGMFYWLTLIYLRIAEKK